MWKVWSKLLSAGVLGLTVSLGTAQAGAPLDTTKLKVALQTATQEENGFLDHLSDLVVSDKLPRHLVESTLLWARKKPEHKFQYFKRAITLRAAKIGVAL